MAMLGPLAELWNIAMPFIGSGVAAEQRKNAPTAPDFRKVAPRGLPGPGNDSKFRMQPTSSAVDKELGISQFPGQVGPDFLSNTFLEDTARSMAEQKERRGLEETALTGFTKSFDEGMSRYKGVVDQQFGDTLREGKTQFGDAIASVMSRYGEADIALASSIRAITSSISDIKGQRNMALAEMDKAAGEFRANFSRDTASLVGLQVTQMDQRGRMEYEEISSEMAASGIPQYQQQQAKMQFRLGIAKDIGDVAKAQQTERQFQLDTFMRESDSEMNAFRNNIGQVIANQTAEGGRAIATGFGRWVDSKAQTAAVEADIRTGYAEWKSSVTNNWAQVEGNIRAHDFAGRAVIADMYRTLTIPSFRLAPLVDGLLSYQNMESQTDWQNRLMEFGIKSSIDTFEFGNYVNAANTMLDYSLAQQQMDSAEKMNSDTNSSNLLGGLASGGGAILGGMVAGPPGAVAGKVAGGAATGG